MSISYYNGEICALDSAKIPLSDRCVFFGDGVYDAGLGFNGRVHLLHEHTDRLIRGANTLGIPCIYTQEDLEKIILAVVSQSEYDCFMVYFQLTRNGERRVHSARGTEKSNLLITVTPSTAPNPNERIKLVSYPDKRYLYCNIKTLNLLPSVLASTYADERGCDEAVFVRDGIVTECAHSNISIVKGDVLYTHPECEKILSGITRKQLLTEARKIGITMREKAFTLGELYSADEVIVTSSTKLARLATEVDGIRYESKKGSVGENLVKALHTSFVNNA